MCCSCCCCNSWLAVAVPHRGRSEAYREIRFGFQTDACSATLSRSSFKLCVAARHGWWTTLFGIGGILRRRRSPLTGSVTFLQRGKWPFRWSLTYSQGVWCCCPMGRVTAASVKKNRETVKYRKASEYHQLYVVYFFHRSDVRIWLARIPEEMCAQLVTVKFIPADFITHTDWHIQIVTDYIALGAIHLHSNWRRLVVATTNQRQFMHLPI